MWYFGPLLLAGAALGAPATTPPAGGPPPKALVVASGRNVWYQFADDGNSLPAAPSGISGTVDASTEAHVDSSGTIRLTGTVAASSEAHADSAGTIRITGTAEGSAEAHTDSSGAVRITGTATDSAESYADSSGSIRVSGTVAGSSESHADSSGTFTYTGTVEGSSESHADSSGTLKYTGTVEGSTESYADASGTVGATVLAAEDDRFHFIVPESWTVPHPVFFAGGDFGWANLEQNDLYRPPMPWPLPQPRYVQAPDETPELSESVTPDTPAGGMNAKALPVPSGQNLWFRFTDDGNDLATSTTVTGTVEASSESYAEASGTFRITGTAEASAESYADASGALRITGTAEANTESYAGASGALRITGTVEGSTESYAEATGTVSTAVVAEEDRNTPLTLWPVVQPNRVWFPDDVPQFSTTITGTVEASSEAYADALAGLTYTGTVEASTESHVFSAGTVTTPRGTEAGGGILDLDRKKKKKKRVQVAQTPEELGVVLGRLSPDARKRYEEMAATPGFDPMLIVAFLAMEFVDE